VLAVVLVAYPLSWGPAAWLDERELLPACTAVRRFYDPLNDLIWDGPPLISAALLWYIDLWVKNPGDDLAPPATH
jgi:hypothetical protein